MDNLIILSSQKKSLSHIETLQLEALAEEMKSAADALAEQKKADRDKKRASDLMREVRQLGHYPDRFHSAENGLYLRVTRARSQMLFNPADEAELQEMQWMAQRQQEQFDLEENVASQMPSSQELHSQAREEVEKMILGWQEDE